MLKKIFIVALLTLISGSFSLNAAVSKADANAMFKKIISEKWNRKYFVSNIPGKFFSNGSWKFAVAKKADWSVFVVSKVREKPARLSISGNFKNKKGVLNTNERFEFVFVKRSGKWLIGQLFYKNQKGKYFKFNFQKNCFEALPEVEGLDEEIKVEGLDEEIEVEGL
ncbi:MAG: hypothetical protein E7047_06795 [Lentisphaerae bacterium]|nr:hypothetical protein [Lentisphaerota bacterium]